MTSETLVLTADDSTFESHTAAGDVLVDVGAEWCPPCRAMHPILEDLARDLAGQVKVLSIDADVARNTARRLAVTAMPTFLLLRNGQITARTTGAMPKRLLRERLGI